MALWGLTALLTLSCSVMEDRSECPCALTLDLSDVDYGLLNELGLEEMEIIVVSESADPVRKTVSLIDAPVELVLTVPRADVDLCAVCGGESIWKDSSQLIPEGKECPRYYVFTDSFDARSENLTRKVTLHRNHCILNVRLKESYGYRPGPFQVIPEGNVCGFDYRCEPVGGPFRCESPFSVDGICHVCIPRQKDSSLRLGFRFKDSGEVRTFPVGEYIVQSGYDWTAPDLEDIDLEVDFSLSGITFLISMWKKELYFEMKF